MLRVKDELWLYYSGSPLKHEEVTLKQVTKPQNERVYSRVVTRLDRFVAAASGVDGGSFTTPPLRYTGNALRLNVSVQRQGRVRVGLLDKDGRPIPGHTVEDCTPIGGDSLSARVKWKTNRDLARFAKGPIRLRVEMKNARLFGFQFTPR